MTTIYQGTIRQNNWLEKLVRSKLFWLIFCTFFFAYPIYRSVNRVLPPELPFLSEPIQFELLDENGKVFTSQDLQGKVYIANFHFTSCPTVCVQLMQKMQEVQKRIRGVGNHMNIVSFTVDPENDTPQKLFKYARDLKANSFVWKFLTGDKANLEKTLLDNFKVPVGEKTKIAEDVFDIAHSGKFVLVDQDGRIRGYYSTDEASINTLMIDTGLLINRKKES